MKKLLLLALLLLPTTARAQWKGSLDLGYNPAVCGFRDLGNGSWLAGYCKRLWSLSDNGAERLHVGAAHVWSAADSGRSLVMVTAGVPTGTLGLYVQEAVDHVAPNLTDYAKPLSLLSNLVSLDIGGGPSIVGLHAGKWSYAIGGNVTIPLDALLSTLGGK